MRFFFTIALSALFFNNGAAQQWVMAPDFIDVETSYRNRVIGIEYEPEYGTYMIAGDFQGGLPNIARLNRITDNGENYFNWDPVSGLFIAGVEDNFFRTPEGYRFNTNMVQVSLDGSQEFPYPLSFDGMFQQTTTPPRGWADDEGNIYVGCNWVLEEEEGQPETCLLRYDAEANRDTTFPLVRCGHPIFFNGGYIDDVHEYDENRIIVGGGFDSLNGHFTPRMAMLFKDGTVDTTFVSHLEQHLSAHVAHIDDDGKILVHHNAGGSEETPNDDIEVWRLNPDGTLDTTWTPLDLMKSNGSEGSLARSAKQFENGDYLLYGTFDFVNGHARSGICVTDSIGNVQDDFSDLPFFVDDELHTWFFAGLRINDAAFTEDGGILLGGRFSGYNSTYSLNLIKVIPSTVGTVDRNFPLRLQVYPNPTEERFSVSVDNPQNKPVTTLELIDLSGRTVRSVPWRSGTEIDVSSLDKGMYVVKLIGPDGVSGVEKVVVE